MLIQPFPFPLSPNHTISSFVPRPTLPPSAGIFWFRLAHICYNVVYFWDFTWNAWGLLCTAAALVPSLLVVYPKLTPELRVPVISYSLVLTSLLWSSVSGKRHSRTMAFIGAALFCCSDMLLFLNRFYFPLPHGHVLVHVTYYASQWLMVLAVIGQGSGSPRHSSQTLKSTKKAE